MSKTIVIGTGISAAAYLVSVQQYLTSLNQSLGDVYQVGGRDLWHSVHRGHAMGQPRQLLTGNLLGSGRSDRGFTNTPTTGTNFMQAGIFADLVQHHLDLHSHANIPETYVSRICAAGQGYSLQLSGSVGGKIKCDKVIIAMGPGPARALTVGEKNPTDVNIKEFGGYIVGGNEFMDPNWKMPNNESIEDCTVAVYGGSATAAWVVELADMRKMKVLSWFTRPGSGNKPWDENARFSEAFPPGKRNSEVEKNFRGIRTVRKLISITQNSISKKLTLTFKNEHEQTIVEVVDILVYALGAEHSLKRGIRTILDEELQKSLVAFYDKNLAISSRPSLLAIGTEDRSLMIIGSAMSSEAGFTRDSLWLQGDPRKEIKDNTKEKLASYREISATLPPAARPTEGIAMVMAGIEALNEYMPVRVAEHSRLAMFSTPQLTTSSSKTLKKGSLNPNRGQDKLHDIDFVWDINFNTSNRTQLAVYIAQTTDLPPFSANLAVALILRLRTLPGNVLGLSDPNIKNIISVAEYYGRELVRLNPQIDVDEKRLKYDQYWGVDRFLDICAEHATTDTAWKRFWKNFNIEC